MSNHELVLAQREENTLSKQLLEKVVGDVVSEGFYGEEDGSDWVIGRGRGYKVALRDADGTTYDITLVRFIKTKLKFEEVQLYISPVNTVENLDKPDLNYWSVYRFPDFVPLNLPRIERTIQNPGGDDFLSKLIDAKVDQERIEELFNIFADDPKYKWSREDENPREFFEKPINE